MFKSKTLFTLILFFFALTLAACGRERGEPATVRPGDKVIIAIVWPFAERNDLFWKGVQMAVDDVNEAEGVLGRKLQVIWYDDGNSPVEAKLLAQKIAGNPRIAAVIGHYESEVALAAAPIYQFGGMLFISAGATTPRLLQADYDLVFRNIPSDTLVAKQLADFFAKRGYDRVLVISAKDQYGVGLGNTFEQRARENGITIVDRRSYRVGQSDFSALLVDWEDLESGSIFLAGRPPEAARFAVQARQSGINVPITGGTGLYHPDFLEQAGRAAEGTIAASFFYLDLTIPEVQQFSEVFQKRFRATPDVWAAQGYDAVKLLVYAMNQAGSAESRSVAEYLRSMEEWTGVTGRHVFEGNGDITKPVVLNYAHLGKYEYFMRTVADENTLRIGMVANPDGITDSGFNQLAWRGMQDAERDFGVFIDFLNTRMDDEFTDNINTFIEKGYDLIVTVGFEGANATQAAAVANPHLPFAAVDVNFLTEPNVLNSQFAVDEASFLAGYLAAGVSRTGKVATYGGIRQPPVEKFMVGFEHGVAYYNQQHFTDVEVLGWSTAAGEGLFAGNWTSFEDGYALGEQLYDQGADVIFPVAGDVGKGTAAIAQERGLMVIGVDTDWYFTMPAYREVFLTSVLKNVNLVPYAAANALVDGTFDGGLLDFGLTDGGVGLADFHDQADRVSSLTQLELEGLVNGIINGTVSTGWEDYLARLETRPAGEELAGGVPSEEGVDEAAQEKVVLRLGSWRLEDLVQMNRILELFGARYPQITVQFQPSNAVEYNTTLREKLENGTAPDLFYLRSFATSRQLFEDGYLEPLDDLAALRENFVPQALAPWATDEGLPYGVPFIAVSHGIYYNVDLFEQLGLGVPTTWEELQTAAQTIQDAGFTPFANGSGDPWTIAEIVFMNLAPNFIGGRDGRLAYLSGKRCFNDEHTVAAFQALADIAPFLPGDQQTVTYDQSRQLFLQGQAAMFFGGSWDISYFEAAESRPSGRAIRLAEAGTPEVAWSIFAVPAPAGQMEHVTFHLDAGIGLNAASRNKEAARLFLEWLTSFEAAQALGNQLPGFFPINKQIPTFESEHASTFLSLNAGRGTDVRWAWEGLLDGSPDGYTLMQDGAVAVINGEMTPQEAADALQNGLAEWFEPAQTCGGQ